MPRARLPLAIVLAPVLLCALPAAAQEQQGALPPVFTSDRPGFANSARPAARGHLTTELGVGVEIGDGTTTADLPRLFMRTGILEWLEARVRVPDAIGIFQPGGATFGLDDPRVGFKVGGAVADTVAISTDWEISLPVGTDSPPGTDLFGHDEPELFADAQLDWQIFGSLTITPNAFAAVRVAPDPVTGRLVRYFRGGGSLKLRYRILDVLSVYVQSYALASDRLPLSVVVGGGVFGMVLPNVQVDASFNAGVLSQDMPPNVTAGTTILW